MEVPLTLPFALVMWDIGTKLIFLYFAIFFKKNCLGIQIFLQVQSKCPGEMPRSNQKGETHKLITYQLPLTLNWWMFVNKKEPCQVQIFY